jgi:hypothetical protein
VKSGRLKWTMEETGNAYGPLERNYLGKQLLGRVRRKL